MKKLMAFYFLNRITKNPMVAATIYKILYEGADVPVVNSDVLVGTTTESIAPVYSTKKEEVEASLKYLKGKTEKTRKDKEAIQMLEAVLNNL